MSMLFALLALIQTTHAAPIDVTNQAATQPTHREASELAAGEAVPEAAPRVVCHRESVMGSNRQRRVCTTEQQRDNSRESARRVLERHTSGVPGEVGPGDAPTG